MGFTPLSERREYTFPKGTFDVRGWAVRTMADEEKVGEVDDVLIDEAGELRYLDVDLGLFQKHVLLPIGQARVDERKDVVWVPGMTKEQFREIPSYAHDAGTVTPEYEHRLAAAYSGAIGGARGGGGGAPAVRGPRGGASGEAGRLASMGDLEGFDVADGDPDPRGWEVIAADDRVVGSVHELVVDTTAMKVRYLDCDVDEEALGLEKEDRHILIPIGYARLDEENEKVVVDAFSGSDVQNLPVFDGLPMTHGYEAALHRRLAGGFGGGAGGGRRRNDEERFYAPRLEGGGGGRRERTE